MLLLHNFSSHRLTNNITPLVHTHPTTSPYPTEHFTSFPITLSLILHTPFHTVTLLSFTPSELTSSMPLLRKRERFGYKPSDRPFHTLLNQLAKTTKNQTQLTIIKNTWSNLQSSHSAKRQWMWLLRWPLKPPVRLWKMWVYFIIQCMLDFWLNVVNVHLHMEPCGFVFTTLWS